MLFCRRRPRWSRLILSSAKTTAKAEKEETVVGGRWSGARSGDQERSSECVKDALTKSTYTRGHVHMMSTLGGGPPKADDSTDKLQECDSDKGEGVKKSENFADVICTWPRSLF